MCEAVKRERKEKAKFPFDQKFRFLVFLKSSALFSSFILRETKKEMMW